MANIALIIAGGRGERTFQDIPKQFFHIQDKPVIIYTMSAFQNHPMIDAIEVVCLKGWTDILSAYAKQYDITKLENIVEGGECGQQSIYNGINDLIGRYSSEDDIVMIHDAIRPLVTQDIISDNLRVCREKGNATTIIPCASAVMKTEDQNSSVEHFPRDDFKITQTPQSFYLQELYRVHKEAMNKGINNSIASCTLYTEMGKRVFFSIGSDRNIKITNAEDVDLFMALLKTEHPSWMKRRA